MSLIRSKREGKGEGVILLLGTPVTSTCRSPISLSYFCIQLSASVSLLKDFYKWIGIFNTMQVGSGRKGV